MERAIGIVCAIAIVSLVRALSASRRPGNGRWFGLALNGLMVAATPIDGSHYFIDVFAGLTIALICWFAAQRIADWAAADSRGTAAGALDANSSTAARTSALPSTDTRVKDGTAERSRPDHPHHQCLWRSCRRCLHGCC